MIEHSFRHSAPLSTFDAKQLRFRRQWAFIKKAEVIPDNWIKYVQWSDFALYCHKDLVVEAYAYGDLSIIALGMLYDPQRPMMRLKEILEGTKNERPVSSLAEFESQLPCLAGCHAIIALTRDGAFVYTDPAAMMSVFYSDQGAASTPKLLPGAERSSAVDNVYKLRLSDDWYPGSLTPYVGVKSLLANHRLEVPSGLVSRFWPIREPDRLSAEEGIEVAVNLLKGAARAVVERGPTLVSLTGGRDSRVVLASCRDLVEKINFFTIKNPNVKKCDIEIPQLLATRFDLNYKLVEASDPPPWLLEIYDEASSNMVVGSCRSIIDGCNKVAGNSYVHLNGNLGALTKSYFWGSTNPRKLDVNILLREFIQRPMIIRDALREWANSVPDLAPTTAYNLMYLEQRGGRYMSIRETASALFYAPATPFNSRALFDAISGVPTSVQFGGSLLTDYVGKLWPDLLSVPFCRVTRNWGMYIPKRIKEAIRLVMPRPR